MNLTDKFKQIGGKMLPLLLVGALLTPLNAQQKNKKRTDWMYNGLETSYIGLNIADYITTQQAMKKGAKEANPIMKPFVKNKSTFALIKAGGTLTTIYFSRKIKKENPKTALGLLLALNIFYGYVVNNNYQVNLQLSK